MTCNIISARLTSRSFPAVSDYSKSKLWKIVRMAEDWRDGSSCMQHLIAKLHLRQTQGAVLTLVPLYLLLYLLNSCLAENFSDVTFKLPDGSSVPGHRLILAIASPFFEAQFYGRFHS